MTNTNTTNEVEAQFQFTIEIVQKYLSMGLTKKNAQAKIAKITGEECAAKIVRIAEIRNNA